MPARAVQVKFSHFRFDPEVDLLGEGPLSEVYKAVDLNLGRTVALKILRPHAEIDPEADTRFMREAKHTSRLEHPNIATIYEYGEDSGRAFIAMEYCRGRTLDRIIAEKILGIEESLRIALQLTAALKLVHQHGLIHRDLKPANIMLLDDGTLKLLDFGICRASGEQTITQHGMLVGTVLYMSPEQVRGENLDARSDIFAMGSVLYHAMTGKLPFPGESFPEVCMGILDSEPVPLGTVRRGFPHSLENFVMTCLSKNGADRYANAEVAHGALMAVADNLLGLNNGLVNSEITGSLFIPPLSVEETSVDGQTIAAGLRKDLSNELSRSTGLKVMLLEDRRIPSLADTAFVVWGSLNVHDSVGKLDLIIEQSIWGDEHKTREIWRERIEQREQDEWALQAQLVRAAARTVRNRLAEHHLKPTMVEVKRRDTKKALELADRAHDLLHRGLTRHLLASISLFRRSIDEDPVCALPYAGLAEALVRKYLYWDGDKSFLIEARENARRSLALNSSCAEAHTALGFEYHLGGHVVDAQREYRLAIQLNKQEWLAHRLLGAVLAREGNLREASPLLRRAIALKPTYISTYDHLYSVLRRLDRYQEAIEVADRGISAAVQRIETAQDDQDARLHLAILYARIGLRDDALGAVADAQQRAPKDGFTSFHIGIVHALLGDSQEAVAALAAAQGRGFFVKTELNKPELDILRGSPEFEALG
jgi:serine/threonine protein kinase/tetratricopeptide (TPR) repeat protein